MRHPVCTFYLTTIMGVSLAIPLPGAAQSSDHFSVDPSSLLESGQALLQSGAFTDAQTVFTQLFTNLRVTEGLYHESQIAALDRLIAVSLAQGDWDDFNRHLGYYEWLTERLYQHQSTLRAEHLQSVAQWHQLAAMASLDTQRTWHLIRARNLTWQVVSALEAELAGEERLAPLLYSIALNHYYLINESSRRGLTSMEVRTDEPVMLSGWAMNGGETGRRSYAVGSELIERIVRIYRESSETDNRSLAVAETYAGDWHQMFGRQQRALAHYKRAADLLIQSGDSDLLAQLFGTGTTLPVAVFDARPPEHMTLAVDSTDSALRSRRPVLMDGEFREASLMFPVISTDTTDELAAGIN
jgi:tetratricopeptide (TPR) repeat protein